MPPYHGATRKHPQARGPNLPKRGLPVEMVEAARDDDFVALLNAFAIGLSSPWQ